MKLPCCSMGKGSPWLVHEELVTMVQVCKEKSILVNPPPPPPPATNKEASKLMCQQSAGR